MHIPKVSGTKTFFLILYVDDILLATNNKGMEHEMKKIISKKFVIKYMGETSYVISIKIHRNSSCSILCISQETYINKVLEGFQMKDCSPSVAPILKGDKLSLNQCLKKDLKKESMKNIPYAFVDGSLIHAQVCTKT